MLFQLPSSANTNECPDKWIEQMPTLSLLPVNGISNNMPYQWWGAILKESDGSRTDSLPDSPLMKKIKSFGTDIAANFGYEVSTKQDFSKLKSLRMNSTTYTTSLREFPPQESGLRSMGFINGDYIRYYLDVSVKGCQPQKLFTNTIRLTGLLEDGIGIDKYLENPMTTDSGGVTNFEDAAAVKAAFETNVANVLKNPVVNKPILLVRPKTVTADFYWGNAFYALSSPECVVMDQQQSVTFKFLPCKFGIFATSKLTDIKREGPLAYWTAGRPLFDSTLIASYTATDNLKEEKSETASSPGSNQKKSTITCTKGKVSKKVTAVNPKCPAGYKKK